MENNQPAVVALLDRWAAPAPSPVVTTPAPVVASEEIAANVAKKILPAAASYFPQVRILLYRYIRIPAVEVLKRSLLLIP